MAKDIKYCLNSKDLWKLCLWVASIVRECLVQWTTLKTKESLRWRRNILPIKLLWRCTVLMWKILITMVLLRFGNRRETDEQMFNNFLFDYISSISFLKSKLWSKDICTFLNRALSDCLSVETGRCFWQILWTGTRLSTHGMWSTNYNDL